MSNTYIDVTKLSIDANATIWFSKLGIGVWLMNTGSEVYDQSILGSLEYQLSSKFRVGYAYDFKAPTINSNLPINSPGTINGLHQIMLRYETDFGNSRKIDLPRYF